LGFSQFKENSPPLDVQQKIFLLEIYFFNSIIFKCEELVRKGLSDAGQIEDLQSKVRDLEDKCTLLHVCFIII